MTDAPLYRPTEENTHLGLGFYKKGQEFEHMGWPKCASGAVEGVNAASQRLIAYWLKHRFDPNLPPTPYLNEYGKVFLPAHLPQDARSNRQPALPEAELPTMPRWKATWRQTFGGREVEIGDEFAFCGWPTMGGLDPINEQAKMVVGYLEQASGHPKLLSAPWCEYAQELFLPTLPEMPKQVYARDITESRRPDSFEAEINRDRIARAQKSLRTAATRANRGTRRRVEA